MLKYATLTIMLLLFSGCATRSLTTGEIDRLALTYGNHYLTQDTQVTSESVKNNKEFQNELEKLQRIYPFSQYGDLLFTRPFVINNKIYYPKELYWDDFSKARGPIDYLDWGDFIHENCHVFAYQVGLRSAKHDNQRYTWKLGLEEQIYPGPNVVYDIDQSDIHESSELSDFYFEQQCQVFKFWGEDPNNPNNKVYAELIYKALEDLSYDTSIEDKNFEDKTITYKGNFDQLKSKLDNLSKEYNFGKCSADTEIYHRSERSNITYKLYTETLIRNDTSLGCGWAVGGIKTRIQATLRTENIYDINVKLKYKEPVFIGVSFYKRNLEKEKELFNYLKKNLEIY